MNKSPTAAEQAVFRFNIATTALVVRFAITGGLFRQARESYGFSTRGTVTESSSFPVRLLIP